MSPDQVLRESPLMTLIHYGACPIQLIAIGATLLEVRDDPGYEDEALTIGDLADVVDHDDFANRLEPAARQNLLATLTYMFSEFREMVPAELRKLEESLHQSCWRDVPPGQPASTVGHPHGAPDTVRAAKGGEA